jgi:hypothetical protein
MKKMILSLMIVLMSMMASTPASAKTDMKALAQMVPTNIVVKQTTHFNDGRTLTIYYKKSGTQCEVYSPCNANDYNVDDASKIKSTTFEIADHVEGRLYKKATVSEVRTIVKRLVNQYL